ncbi:VOC family protein [Lysobacter niabensis]|uniref:VOC family protein n=1 Tax=Agrilutibacter niabensis TaxID=380628 RepID=UPI0036224964
MEVLSQRIVLTFYTEAFDSVIAFYSRLGLVVAKDIIMAGGERWLVLARADNPSVQLHFHPPGERVPAGHVQPIAFALSNADVVAVAEGFRADGIPFEEWEVPWAYSISVKDPVGNTVTVSHWHSITR